MKHYFPSDYAQLKEYLSMLIENGLREYNEVDKFYKITSKGHKFMKVYNQLGSFRSRRTADRGIAADVGG